MDWKSKLNQDEKLKAEKIEKNLVECIIEFESGSISIEDLKWLFAVLTNSQKIWSMQGFYGRAAVNLIQNDLFEIRFETQKYDEAVSKLSSIQKLLIGLDLEASISKWQNNELSEVEMVYLINCLYRNNKKIWCNDNKAMGGIVNGLRQKYFHLVPSTNGQGGLS